MKNLFVERKFLTKEVRDAKIRNIVLKKLARVLNDI